MSPEDPRHGTNAGYLVHAFTDRDYCQPCRNAHAVARRQLWRKRYTKRVDRLLIDATGTIRRIRALQALGWRYIDIDRAAGRNPQRANATWSHNLVTQQRVHIDSARVLAKVYDELSMTLATNQCAERTRKHARRMGYAPPLAWTNIDDPAEQPRGTRQQRIHKTDIDPVVVERVISGDRLPMTTAERYAVVSTMREQGWSFLRIEAQTGIGKPERYVARAEGVA